ncbi:MAG: zf-HC2 domain-containing protein, partial [Firmicutes bacterium]|nr:zf-HC2 domain-containing protein [Bacillota bacterium]
MLHAYVAGELNSASALVVSTHLDMCPHCRRMANAVEEELACEFESAPA